MNYAVLLLAAAMVASGAPPIKVLIVDGQNNHAWQQTTPVLKKILEETGRFTVDVATTPPKGADMSSFHPDFSSYAVILSNYNGDPWPAETNAKFEAFVRNGGGFVWSEVRTASPSHSRIELRLTAGCLGGRVRFELRFTRIG